MAQHFLLSAQARTLSLKDIYKAGEEAAYETFRAMRWADTHGEAVCPRCGCTETYDIATRRKFKCVACHHQFSVTSGTIFASRKMDFSDLLAAICLFVNGVKGMSALQMSRDLDVQYKTAFVMMHKLREVLAAEMRGLELSGEVEIDGCYIGGHIRPSNLKEDRVDRRLAKHQTGTRRVVVALRQRGGRTLPFIARREGEGVEIASRIVADGSTIFADEAAHWDDLVRDFPMGRINHSEAYSLHGKHTNNVESFFSRLRRMIRGQHHKVSPQYLHQYASEAAWKEDHRSVANGAQAGRVISLAMALPVSRAWAGYWQRAA
ncbi:IS1595 family transposase [Maricaulis sp.]|uniref:IS1595 family transposase n=1 Tax=Maricaulis sp. TaxID=1486257 RepID=UPI003A8FE18E